METTTLKMLTQNMSDNEKIVFINNYLLAKRIRIAIKKEKKYK